MKLNTKTIWLVLSLAVVVGALLRLVWLDKYPVGATGDELQEGYTGYSILKTGKDEWGDTLPLNPRGFGDYKPPLYSYLTIGPEALLGLNLYAVRLPAAMAGIGMILVAYFLAEELFESQFVGLAAAILSAITPWDVEYSRIGWESRLGTFFFGLGLLLFLKGLKRYRYLPWAALSLGLSLYTYHSFKIFVPLIMLVAVYLYRNIIFKLPKKIFLISLIIVGVLGAGMAYSMFFSGGGRRAADAAIYNPENILPLRDIQTSDHLPQPWGRVINNKQEFIGSKFVENYLGYYSTSFLFSGQRENSTLYNLPGEGLFYVWEVIFLGLGLFYLIKGNLKYKNLILAWFLLAPIPASLTRDYMHAQRVESYLVCITFITAYGVGIFENWLKPRYRNLSLIAAVLIIGWSLIGRIDHYLYHEFNHDLGGLKSGYQQVIDYTESQKGNYNQIVFTKEHSEPQIFVAFYTNMDPRVYQGYSGQWKNFEQDGFRFLDMINYPMGKYYFRQINWDKDRHLKNVLLVGGPRDFPQEVPKKLIVNDAQGDPMFVVVDAPGEK